MDKSRSSHRAPGAQMHESKLRNSLKTPENSQKSSQLPEAGISAAQDAQRAQLLNSETPVKKLRFLPFLFLKRGSVAPGARRENPCNLRNKIPVFCEKNFEMHLDLPGDEGIYTRPGHLRDA